MRTLIYKRTHTGDPDPISGTFGNRDCMGRLRSWNFDAIIGIGGIGSEPKRHRIAGRLTWVGIGPRILRWDFDARGPQLIFRKFVCFDETGPLMRNRFPALARHIYDTNCRHWMHISSAQSTSAIDLEVESILQLAPAKRTSGGGLAAVSRCSHPQSANARAAFTIASSSLIGPSLRVRCAPTARGGVKSCSTGPTCCAPVRIWQAREEWQRSADRSQKLISPC